MIIDIHTHVHTPEDAARPFWRGRCPMTIENVLDAQKRAGIDATVVSNPLHDLKHMDAAEQLAACEAQNRYVAELQDKYDSIYGFATTVPYGGDKFMREFERAVKEDGLKGAWIISSLKGQYPDDDEALPFFQLASELDVPVVIHPPSVGFGEERLNIYRLASSVGRPMDLALALSRLIVKGIFERFPKLKLVGSHLGGGICEMIGRMDYAYSLGDEAFFLGSYEPMLIKKKPSEYLKMMYLESTCYHPPAARCAVETVGPDHFLFGTDAPPLKSLKPEGVAVIKKLGLSPADEQKVFCDNAKRILKI
ncbi:MAG TPA: amidohydrolase family protein [Stellaceae bacterium]|nr:amidohydrolase family protein [Stellaceae bacterium]